MLRELAQAVRDGAIDPVDLVAESLRRIDAAADLNAVVARRDEDALDEARAHPRTGALAGLPLLVKDMARCRGTRTTFGSATYADAPLDEVDDEAVGRLRAAGAIVVGRSNTPAFGHAPFTSNGLYGATRNPWNPSRSPGGSSGGSAAALAAGLVPLATTSDGGGSVRIPASLCGLVGYKPTTGAIGRNVLPRWIEFSTQGSSGHSVDDVVAESSVTHGAASGDWMSLPAGSVPLTPRPPDRVAVCRTFRADVDEGVEAAFEATVEAVAASGIAVERVDAPAGVADVLDWFTMSTAELAQSLMDVRDRWDEFDDSLRQQLEYGASVTLDAYLTADRRRHELGRRLDDVVGVGGVLMVPTLNAESWPPEGPATTWAGAVRDDPSIAANTPEINSTGHPAVSVPMGFDSAGVPTGCQIIARRLCDDLALGLAAVLERERPWPLVAPGYEPFGSAV